MTVCRYENHTIVIKVSRFAKENYSFSLHLNPNILSDLGFSNGYSPKRTLPPGPHQDTKHMRRSRFHLTLGDLGTRPYLMYM